MLRFPPAKCLWLKVTHLPIMSHHHETLATVPRELLKTKENPDNNDNTIMDENRRMKSDFETRTDEIIIAWL